LFEREPVDLSGFCEESALKISHMSLGQVLVLANEDDGRNPELLCLVLLESLANDLRLTDVGAGCVGKGVTAKEYIDSCLVEFFASQELINFGPGSGDSLSGPVRDLTSA
jgi:hypothetical protein